MAVLVDEHKQWLDGNLPIVNGKVFVGTQGNNPTTGYPDAPVNLITIYSDRELTTAITNPQATDADGRTVNKIWIPDVEYSLVVWDSDDVQKYISLNEGKKAGELKVSDIAELKTTEGDYDGQFSYVAGYYSTGDGGGGDFYWAASSTETADDGMIVQVTGVTTGRWKRTAATFIDGRQAGSKGDGTTDDSSSLLSADATGQKVTCADGNYLLESETNPTFSGGLELINADIVGTKDQTTAIVKFDNDNLIGLMHNHQEKDETDYGGSNTAITSGIILAPPISKALPDGRVDLIGYWYNDFGLEYTRAGNGATGALDWYYWDWNHTDNVNYDPKRHPWLGWYRGDDANVLDWQCYWLKEYGFTGVVLGGYDIDKTSWATSSNISHWIYQLFTNVPNFEGLNWVLWGRYLAGSINISTLTIGATTTIDLASVHGLTTGDKVCMFGTGTSVDGQRAAVTVTDTDSFTVAIDTSLDTWNSAGTVSLTNTIEDDWDAWRTDFVETYENVYTVSYKDKSYPVLFIWDSEIMRGAFDNYSGYENYKAFLIEQADALKALGWGGIAIMARNGGSFGAVGTPELDDNDVIFLPSSYDGIGAYDSSFTYQATSGATYPLLESNYNPTIGVRQILNLATSKESQSPHPSGWTWTGSTPELFESLVKKAVREIEQQNAPKILTIYNIAEWAEGGASLQPNVNDGFGYLEACKKANSKNNHRIIPYINDDGSSIVSNTLRGNSSISTTDATVTSIWERIITDESAFSVSAVVYAKQSGSAHRALYRIDCLAYSDGGTRAIQGQTPITTQESNAAWACVFDVSGSILRLRVTGAAAVTIDWRAEIEINHIID